LTLIPSFFLIGRWGLGSGRRDAARKFFLYTLAGSLLTLLGVIGVVLTNPTPIHPQTGTRMSEAVAMTDTLNRSEVIVARRGPVTFSLPDLMGNVQAWASAEETARMFLHDAQANHAFIQALPGATPAEKAVSDKQLESANRALAEAEQIRAASVRAQFWLFIAIMAGFMVKVPIWPFHTWLPAAYGEAPTGVTVLLSAVMAKLGTFGILRLVLPLVPDAAITYGLPVVGVLAAFGIIYAALCAYASKDMKLLVAYSSVSHLGFVVLALFAFNREGLTGAVLHMVNHGLATGALFATLGFFLDRYRTTEMARYGGMMGRFPNFAVLAFVICLASIGLPGLNNFVSEMLMMAGLFDAENPGVSGLWPAVIAAIGIFLSAWYTMTMMRRVFFGPLKEPEPVAPETTQDVTRREFFALGTLAALCLLLGLWPQPVIDTMKGDVRTLANIGDAARARAKGVPYVSKEPREVPRIVPVQAPKGPQGPPGGGKKGKGGKGKGGKGPVTEE
jgi:NADH-quinone oxidoreductase subunit M